MRRVKKRGLPRLVIVAVVHQVAGQHGEGQLFGDVAVEVGNDAVVAYFFVNIGVRAVPLHVAHGYEGEGFFRVFEWWRDEVEGAALRRADAHPVVVPGIGQQSRDVGVVDAGVGQPHLRLAGGGTAECGGQAQFDHACRGIGCLPGDDDGGGFGVLKEGLHGQGLGGGFGEAKKQGE